MKASRLAKALAREGVHIEHDGPIYRLRSARSDGPYAEVLLAEGMRLETKAVRQLVEFASVRHPEGGHVCRACATPDFHPGELVPVGAVVASADLVIPQAVGSDVNCGMRMHVSDLSVDDFLARKDELVELLRGDLLLGTRDLPATGIQLRAIFDAGVPAWLHAVKKEPLGLMLRTDLGELEEECGRLWGGGSHIGSSRWAEDRLPEDHDVTRDGSLGTVGGGNHFVEFQYVDEVFDGQRAYTLGVHRGQVAFMVHTGSRGIGKAIGVRWSEIARERWPSDHKRPQIFPLRDRDAEEYVEAMSTAANFASVNRLLVAEMVRARLREVYGDISAPLVYDVPHNLVSREDGLYIHRKGATPAHLGQPVLIPGSMGTPSYLMVGCANDRFLNSASHGAGRARSRFEMGRRGRPDFDLGLDGVECVTLREERRVEEAPAAYKDVEAVVNVQVEHGLVRPVARMRPLLTFKS